MPRRPRRILLVLALAALVGASAACAGSRPTLIDEPPPTTPISDQPTGS